MPATANYAWIYPTEGGDIGTWDTILNTLFVDADADVKAVEDIAVKDLTATNNHIYAAGTGFGQGWTFVDDGSPSRVYVNGAYPTGLGTFVLPLWNLRVGQKITAFKSRGWRVDNATCSVRLSYYDTSGARTEVSAGHSLPAAEGDTETTGLTHTVAANRFYFIEFIPTIVDTGDSIKIVHGRVTVATV